MNLQQEVAGLLAREQVRELVTSRLVFAIDWLDLEAMKACFTVDSEVFFGDTAMSGPAFCDMWIDLGATFRMRSHFIDCPYLVIDGNSAKVEARAVTACTSPDPASPGAYRDHLEGSRYFCDIVRQDGTWRISRLRMVFNWSFIQPFAATTAAGIRFEDGMDTGHWLYKHMIARAA